MISTRSIGAQLGGGAIGVLDGSRRWLWRLAARTSAGRACARDRSTRILALGLGHVAAALALAAIAPALLLLIGPIVLGVPHVVADVRYLIVRGPASLKANTILAIMVPLAVLTGFGVLELSGAAGDPIAEIVLGFASVAIAVALAPGGLTRRAIAVGLVALVAVPAAMFPTVTLLSLLFGHNLVALAIWAGVTRRTVRLAHRAAVIGAVAIGVGLIASGAFDRSLAIPYLAFDVDPIVEYRLIVAYAFLQSMHYVVWLRLIPATQARAPGASTFRKSLAGLRADFGAGLLAIAAVVIVVPVLACVLDAEQVRDGYLALVIAHAWLELAIVAYAIVARERLGEGTSY